MPGAIGGLTRALGQRHFRLAVMTAFSTGSRGGAQFLSNYTQPTTTTFQIMKTLTRQLQEPALLRVPKDRNETNTTSDSTPYAKSDLKRRRAELAEEACKGYVDLPPLQLPPQEGCERWKIIRFLFNECSPSSFTVDEALRNLDVKRQHQSSTSKSLESELALLRMSSTPLFEEVLEFMLKQHAVHGMKLLVSLRQDILRVLAWMRTSSSDERLPLLRSLDAFLLRLFSIWFSPGMLGKCAICTESLCGFSRVSY